MTLKTETTVEYYFDKPWMYYCQHHDCLRIVEDHADSVLLNGISQSTLNNFIENYFEYILDDAPMKEYFKERLKNKDEDKMLEDS